MEIEKKDKNAYHKKYYIANRDKINEQVRKSQKILYQLKKDKLKEKRVISTRETLIQKLNNNEYVRMPYSKLRKYNVEKIDGIYQ